MTTKVHITVALMVKNEKKRLHVTLESVKSFSDSICMYDTGSEDNTIQIAKDFCEKENIPLHLIEGEFVDFATSRNVLLDYVDTFEEIDFVLLLDTNDELRNGEKLREFTEEEKKTNSTSTGYLLCQEWWSGQYDKYWNVRFVRAHEGWRYMGVVHEWMKNTKHPDEATAPPVKRVENIVLYQDRTQDDDKSWKRFSRDKGLLLREHKADRTEPRTVFYLAQTFGCLSENDEAFYYYKLRTTLIGFWEERFHAFLRCGELSERLEHPWTESMAWYIQAFEHAERAEPLLKIAEHYDKEKKWLLAHTFARLACELPYPDHCILFVDKFVYDYKRWHQLGIVSYYVGHYGDGEMGCDKAIEYGEKNSDVRTNVELDKSNLKFYIDKKKEIQEQQQAQLPQITKNKFIDVVCQQLSKQHPNLSRKQLANKAKKMWRDKGSK